jgi:hypothetical protein
MMLSRVDLHRSCLEWRRASVRQEAAAATYKAQILFTANASLEEIRQSATSLHRCHDELKIVDEMILDSTENKTDEDYIKESRSASEVRDIVFAAASLCDAFVATTQREERTLCYARRKAAASAAQTVALSLKVWTSPTRPGPPSVTFDTPRHSKQPPYSHSDDTTPVTAETMTSGPTADQSQRSSTTGIPATPPKSTDSPVPHHLLAPATTATQTISGQGRACGSVPQPAAPITPTRRRNARPLHTPGSERLPLNPAGSCQPSTSGKNFKRQRLRKLHQSGRSRRPSAIHRQWCKDSNLSASHGNRPHTEPDVIYIRRLPRPPSEIDKLLNSAAGVSPTWRSDLTY